MFSGLSTLRKKERETNQTTQKSKDLQDYLKKYTGESGNKKKKKRKTSSAANLHLVDEDVTGFAPKRSRKRPEVVEGEEDEAPVVANADEVEVFERQAEKAKKYYTDGGWKAVKETDSGTVGGPPARRSRHDSPDESPPRRARHDSPDLSPPRKSRHDSPDESPPRKARNDSPDLSPPRKARHDSPDLSPPRRRQHGSPDLSPPRKSRHDSPDLSPPRRGARPDREGVTGSRRDGHEVAGGGQDLSPPRRDRHGSRMQRRSSRFDDVADIEIKESSLEPRESKEKGRIRRMADGSAAGVVSGSQLKVELERKRAAEKERLKAIDKETLGEGAETVYRDNKHGKRVSLEDLEKKRAKKKVRWEKVEWSSGLAQQKQAEKYREETAKEAARPFARSRDDEELETMLRGRTRFGDPMAHLVKKRGPSEFEPAPVIDDSNRAMFAKSGYVVPQEIPPHSWLRRGVPAAINRYGILPGRHWDGVDRSNGFEKELFNFKNERAANQKEALMWSQEDM
ncbi:hypothetical protein BSKO_01412 [Bryopsis sp. KO-2023]|nr:hypothetical protein BSKO_01412 [Bryopsis sp. KO-2023]